ncbi:hypothetical protein Tco_1350771, partial [Tanacetum coccineum]
MTTLQFADTHNLVAFLDKPAESEGFEQIVDFLNASSIRYALTVNPTIYTSCIQQFWATVKVKTINEEVQLQALMDGKNIIITEATIRRDLQLEDVEDEVVNEENVSKHSNDTLLSDEDRLKLKELMALCTNLQNRVLDLEHIKTTQALEIDSLKRRVKKLEKKQRSKTHGLKRLYKVGLSARVISSEDEENVHDEDMFGVNDLDGDEVVVESKVTDKDVNLSVDKVTLAQALAALKSAKVQEKGDVIKEPSVLVSAASTKVSTVIPTTVTTTIIAVSSRPRIKVQDKGKGKMNEPEPVKKLSKNDQLRLDEELAFRLQDGEEEEERLTREKAQQIEEANTAWDDIQAKVEADYQLAQRLHNEEQKQYTDEEKAKFFCEFLDQRRKFFTAKRAKAKRNKPPTQAQQRKLYSTYLKNMEGYTLKQLKGFKFEVIKDMFDRA